MKPPHPFARYPIYPFVIDTQTPDELVVARPRQRLSWIGELFAWSTGLLAAAANVYYLIALSRILISIGRFGRAFEQNLSPNEFLFGLWGWIFVPIATLILTDGIDALFNFRSQLIFRRKPFEFHTLWAKHDLSAATAVTLTPIAYYNSFIYVLGIRQRLGRQHQLGFLESRGDALEVGHTIAEWLELKFEEIGPA